MDVSYTDLEVIFMADKINILVYPDKKADKGFRDILGINNIPRITSTAVKTNDRKALLHRRIYALLFGDRPVGRA